MTTRSKKRLQTSLSENSDIKIPKSERKTRSQKIKDSEEFNHSLPKLKKRNNYVTYPSTDEEIKENDANAPIVPDKYERKILRSALREKNIQSAVDTNDNETKSRKRTRLTKQDQKSIEKQSESYENVTLEVDNKNIIVANTESNKKQVLKRAKGKNRKISNTAEAQADLIPQVDDIDVALTLKTSNEQSVQKSRCKSKKVFDDADMMESDDIIDVKNNHYNKADQISLQHVTRSKVCKNNQDSDTLQVEMIESVLAEKNMGNTLENVSGVTDSKQNSTETKKHRRYVKVCKSHITQNQNNITVNDEQYKNSLSPFVTHPETIKKKSRELNESKTSKIMKSVDISREEIIDCKENKASIKKKNHKITPSPDKKAHESFQDKNNMNESDLSVVSFYRAAGSSVKEISLENSLKNKYLAKNKANLLINDQCNVNTFNEKTEANKGSLKNSTYHKIDSSTPKLNLTDDKNRENTSFTATELKSPMNNEYKKNSLYNTFDLKSESNRHSIKNSTYDKIDVFTPKLNSTYDKNTSSVIINTTYDKDDVINSLSVKPVNLSDTFDKTPKKQNKSKGKDNNINSEEEQINTIFTSNTKESLKLNETCDKNNVKGLNSTYEKDLHNMSTTNNDFNTSPNNNPKSNNSTFEIDAGCNTINERNEKNSLILGTISGSTTFDHQINSKKHCIGDRFKNDENLNNAGVKMSMEKDHNSRSSLISSDASTSAGNITDDNSVVNISEDSNYNNLINATPIMIESSINGSNINETFVDNNDHHEVSESKDNPKNTPESQKSLPAPGLTPYNANHKSSPKVNQLNLTHSIEKSRRSSLSDEQSRVTKVMFCSPVDNPEIQNRGSKVVKSSLKGSNKSFIFVQNEVPHPGTRKRSRSHGEVQPSLTEELQRSVNRLSRPKTNINGKQPGATTPNRKILKRTYSSDTKDRLKARAVPNFAALHKKNFDKMESIADFRERKAKRARQLLTPTGKLTVLERSPRDEMDTQEKQNKAPEEAPKVPTLMSLRPGYTRFGFKLNIDVNPFTVTTKPEAKKLKKTELKRPPTMPSLSGVTTRKEHAKNTVMREKSFTSTTEKRAGERKEYRSIIKGVRSNRRFELQMKLRDINN